MPLQKEDPVSRQSEDYLDAFLQENISTKSIYDIPGGHNNVHCSVEGLVAVASMKTVHVYQPNFCHMSYYCVGWISIEQTENLDNNENQKKSMVTSSSSRKSNMIDSDNIEGDEDIGACIASPEKQSIEDMNVEDLIKSEERNAVGMYINSIYWCSNMIKPELASYLVVLFNDGNVFIMQRVGNDEKVRYNVPGKNAYLSILGWEIVSQLMGSNDAIISSCVIEFQSKNDLTKFYLVTGHNKHLKVWKMSESSGTLIFTLSSSLMLPKNSPAMKQICTYSKHHSTLKEHMSGIFLCSHVTGRSSLLQIDASGNFSSQWTSLSTISFEGFMYQSMLSGSLAVIATSLSVVIAQLAHSNLSILASKEIRCNHELPITCLTPSGRWFDDARELQVMTTDLGGRLKVWSFSQSGFEITASLLHEQTDIDALHGFYGACFDPLGLVLFTSYSFPASVSNTRDVQLNSFLLKPHLKLRCMRNLLITEDWMNKPELIGQYLNSIVDRMSSNPDISPVHALAAVFNSLEAIKKDFRVKVFEPFHPSILEAQRIALTYTPKQPKNVYIKDNAVVNEGAMEGDDGSDEDAVVDEEDDYDDDLDNYDPQLCDENHDEEHLDEEEKETMETDSAALHTNSSSNAHSKQSPVSIFTYQDLMASLKDYIDPNPIDLARIGADLLLKGLLFANASIMCPTLSQERRKEIMLQFPSDVVHLDRRCCLWRVWLMLTRGLLSVRNVNSFQGDDFMATVYKRISVARATLIANRCVLQHSSSINLRRSHEELATLKRFAEILRAFSDQNKDSSSVFLQRVARDLWSICGNVVGREECPICQAELSFDPDNPLSSPCVSCGVEIDRCCFTYRLITNITSAQLFRCPLCCAVADYAAVEANRDLVKRFTYCPYCIILMQKV